MFKIKLFIAALIFSGFSAAREGGITNGVRISYYVTEEQISFADSLFDYVMTPFLNSYVRNSFTRSQLFLYRSIQGTWDSVNHFDWNYINMHENMFCHTDSTIQNLDTRIKTIWASYLMQADDMVEPTAPDALTHWINYYAVTASQQVYEYNYDGLYIDSASHLLKSEWLVDGILPWNYSPQTWRIARYNSLKFIKSYFPDKTVVFNGLHSGNGADSSLSVTDGGMWEDFAFSANTGEYKGLGSWLRAINCMLKNRDSSKLILVVKKPGLMNDLQARIFSVASYLLVENENTIFTASDYAYDTLLQYYPEFEIDIGNSSIELHVNSDTLFYREFENGLVLVNPTTTESKTYNLSHGYYKIVPYGGGFVSQDGLCEGGLSYENVSEGIIELPPISAVILQDTLTTDVEIQNSKIEFSLSQNYPNPFNPTTTILYSIPTPSVFTRRSAMAETQSAVKVTLIVYNTLGQKVTTLVNKAQTPGNYTVQFDASDLPSGIYFYSLQARNFVATKKMIFIK